MGTSAGTTNTTDCTSNTVTDSTPVGTVILDICTRSLSRLTPFGTVILDICTRSLSRLSHETHLNIHPTFSDIFCNYSHCIHHQNPFCRSVSPSFSSVQTPNHFLFIELSHTIILTF